MRFIPKDPRAFPVDGWCVTHPYTIPVNCSWCGVPFAHHETAVLCRICDRPHPGGLRVVDLDKECGSE